MTLYSHKVSPQCLSHMRLARLASGDFATTPADTEHLSHCDTCAKIFAGQQQDVLAMTAERVPAKLLAASDAKSRRQSGVRVPWQAWLALTATVCAAMLVIPHGAETPGTPTHVKGIPSLEVSLSRDDALVLDEVPIEKVGIVHVGDRLRVRVVNAQGQHVQLDLCTQEGTCENLFSGALPPDAWIPPGLKIDTPTPTILRLRVCPPGTPMAKCEPHDYTLRGL